MRNKKQTNSKPSSTKKYSSIQRKLDNIILSLSDCDGMCNLCKPSLKTRCFRFKGIDEEDPSYKGLSNSTPIEPK